MIERREYPRESCDRTFRIYTSLTCCAYTVQLKDVSKRGAFIRTNYLPEIGETITFVILSKTGFEIFTGNARVTWINENCRIDDMGFGIELETVLDDELLEDLTTGPIGVA